MGVSDPLEKDLTIPPMDTKHLYTVGGSYQNYVPENDCWDLYHLFRYSATPTLLSSNTLQILSAFMSPFSSSAML